MSRVDSWRSVTRHPPNLPHRCYDYRVINQGQHLSTSDKLERAFYLNLIRLVNEVQGNTKLQSQMSCKHKSAWVKQTKEKKTKKDALTILN